MIRITITAAAFDAVVATLLLGRVGYENATSERYIWLEPYVVDRLDQLRGPGESYSDVIMRVAEARSYDARSFRSARR